MGYVEGRSVWPFHGQVSGDVEPNPRDSVEDTSWHLRALPGILRTFVLATGAHHASQLDDLSFQLHFAFGAHGGQADELDDRGPTPVLAGKEVAELLEIPDRFIADNGMGSQ